MTDQELLCTMALTRVMALRHREQHTLLDAAGSAQTLYEQRREVGKMFSHFSPRAAEAIASMDTQMARCEEELRYARDHHIRLLAWQDADAYPSRLRQCGDAPLVLYQLGSADLNARHVVCIVGTRHCSERGRDFCARMAADLRRLLPGTLVVSGLAYGIDIAAHRAALAEGLPTVAVLAHGLDTIYPPAHRATAVEMTARGALVTEHMSRARVDKVNFVQRNRIVAGLADATVVVETQHRGGSLITARLAMDYNREVFAVPGRLTDATSDGCHHLIRSHGAHLLTSAADLLEDLGWEAAAQPDGQGVMDFGAAAAQTPASAATAPAAHPAAPSLTPQEQHVAAILRRAQDDLSLSDLIVQTALPASQLNSLLFALELKGCLRKLPGNRFHLLG